MIVVLTGAGISQESGISTFRDAGGLWEKHRIEDVATPGAFRRNPDLVYDFYNARRRQLTGGAVNPNAAHAALAELERESGESVLVVTQNVDDLHERAGSKNLFHMHGELLKARCVHCGTVLPWPGDMSVFDACPACGPVPGAAKGKMGRLRPHIVWFEEMPLYMPEIERALSECSTFVSIGTSGNVYPAAGFAAQARSAGAKVVEINMEPSLNARCFHAGHYGPATKMVPAWVGEYLGGKA
ncbi:deacetylase of acetyl-CoA synthetase, NAD-dependent [uncultured delta proteobacterium]|uniref:NAD-dependent protein deacylase n=1 Tax=uncultured delta proteobacterium TaxID=34034 RepID=A0A212JKU4_9DELT|nr:deacetylase of acetyl-CoA synthetase, NAD-dependent [uncultured delta proteobacterium]